MKIADIALVLVMVSMSSIGYGAEPSETLTVKNSEHPEALVNADAKTRLQMTVITPQVTIESGKKYEIKVEIHNPDAHIEIVYMPGLTLVPIYSSDKRVLLPDEYGPPMVFGRMSAKDERLNFVVLAGGDSYVRTYEWTAPAGGQVTFQAVYLNKNNGAEIGVKAISLVSDGESTLSPAFMATIKRGHELGISMASGTNGFIFNRTKLEEILPHLTYLRINFSAGGDCLGSRGEARQCAGAACAGATDHGG